MSPATPATPVCTLSFSRPLLLRCPLSTPPPLSHLLPHSLLFLFLLCFLTFFLTLLLVRFLTLDCLPLDLDFESEPVILFDEFKFELCLLFRGGRCGRLAADSDSEFVAGRLEESRKRTQGRGTVFE
ncbi:MAG: hypothetical protein J07HX64_01206 [halophilic archaeon J07HX64]|nr:MAG: hypothetical protein J07HX64_01206 [halophilic archaeon J07HX64]